MSSENDPLIAYLADFFGIDSEVIRMTKFKGGYSNLTYLVQTGDQEFVLRRPPLGLKISKAHDMGREFRILTALKKAGYRKIPNPVHCCTDESVIGTAFFLMEKVDGLILRDKLPIDWAYDATYFRELSRQAVDHLLELHQLELEESGLLELGKPEGYLRRQVTGWANRYLNAKTDDLAEMESVAKWLFENQPHHHKTAFIHNDFKYDNMVLSESSPLKIRAILDWEMATLGDPLMDLGTSLAYWAEENDPNILKMFGLTYLPGNFTRQEVISHYASKSPIALDHMVFYYAFGLFKVGVIAQQIYQRHRQGFADDLRFGRLIHAVKACGEMAWKSIQTQQI
ncbi:MAG TPA: phosphotransferase family protein [Lunatimonas sp.]|nr:phosphotransferase family protein [Lunatimonas sp.]